MLNKNKEYCLECGMFNGVFPEEDVDHINGVRDDNRIENLRVADRSQNNMNYHLPKDNTSGYRGVYLRKEDNTWYWQLQFRGKLYSGGKFLTAVEASDARNYKAKQLAEEFVYEA